MAGFLISTDDSTDRVYKHDGFSATQLDSFNYTNPTVGVDVAWDGKHFYTAMGAVVKKYDPTLSWSSPLLLQTLTFGTSIYGITWDGANLIVLFSDGMLRQMLGFSTIVQAEFSLLGARGLNQGLAWDGDNLIVTTWEPLGSPVTTIRRYVGLSTTIDTEITLAGGEAPEGVAWDGANLIVSRDFTGGAGTDQITRYVGFSTTVDSTIASPSSQVRGIAWGYELAEAGTAPDAEGEDSSDVEEIIAEFLAAERNFKGLELPHVIKPDMSEEDMRLAIQQNFDAIAGWSRQFGSD
jgi:hypothetical protein